MHPETGARHVFNWRNFGDQLLEPNGLEPLEAVGLKFDEIRHYLCARVTSETFRSYRPTGVCRKGAYHETSILQGIGLLKSESWGAIAIRQNSQGSKGTAYHFIRLSNSVMILPG